MPSGTRALFFSADGALRSGWAVLAWLLVTALLGGSALLGLGLAGVLPDDPGQPLPVSLELLRAALRLALPLLSTWVASRLVRQPFGAAFFADARGARRFGAGLAFGGALVSVAPLVAWLLGELSPRPTDAGASAVLRSGALQAAVFLTASTAEEVVFHGFLFQQLARGVGRWGALAITTALFTASHLANPNLGPLPLLNIALVGMLFGVLTLRLGSLWAAAGAHVAWNFTLAFVFGSPISGVDFGPSLLVQVNAADSAWTGGAFGLEASVQSSAAVLAAISALLLSKRRA